MGHNRAGVRRTARLRRHKREYERLACQEAAASAPAGASGIAEKVAHQVQKVAHDVAGVARGAFHKAGEAVHAAARKLTGAKGETASKQPDRKAGKKEKP